MAPTSDSSVDPTKTIKFLYSYGGRIVPRPTDGVLRYVGGYTRVLSVDRSITFAGLMVKFGESCGSSMDLTCKLPTEDLDLLVSIKSDEELRNVVEEYEKASPEAKIRAVLFPIKSKKGVSPPSSPMSCFDFPSPKKPPRVRVPVPAPVPAPAPAPPSCYAAPPCAAVHHCCPPSFGYPACAVGKYRCYEGWSPSPRHMHQVPVPVPVPHRSCSRNYYYQ